MNEMPLVSVLMTAYNREKYIAEAIESVLQSTYKNFELIIVDDCSKDATVEIAKKYEALDHRIKLHINKYNLGDYANRNNASGFAKGEFLMHVDSDDKILSDGILRCVETMLKFPGASFGMYFPDHSIPPIEVNGLVAIRKHFFEKPFLQIGPGGTIIKRSYFENINGFSDKYGPASDQYFNLKASSKTNIVLLPFEFLYYRRHEGQEINNKYSYLFNNYLYLNDALAEISLGLTLKEIKWLSKKNKRRFIINLLKYLLKSKDLRKTNQARINARFTIKDFFEGVFQL